MVICERVQAALTLCRAWRYLGISEILYGSNRKMCKTRIHKTSVYTEVSLPTHVSGLKVLLGAVYSVEAQLPTASSPPPHKDSCHNLDL